jgi:hypothetical protein
VLGVLFHERRCVVAGKRTRKEPSQARARASVIKTGVEVEETPAQESRAPKAPAASDASRPNGAAPCTRSHVPNARTRKTLRDADAGKNLTRYADEDELFRKLGIELGQGEA